MIGRLYLEVKSLRVLMWLAPFVILILTPVLILAELLSFHMDFEICGTTMRVILQQFVPLCSIWWPTLVFREYLDSPGNELLHAFRRGGDNLICRALALWGVYCAILIVPSIVYSFFWLDIPYLFIGLVVQSLFLTMLAYCIAMVCKNTFLPLLSCLVIGVYSYIFPKAALSPFEFYSGLYPSPGTHLRLLILLACSLVLLILGFWREKRLFR